MIQIWSIRKESVDNNAINPNRGVPPYRYYIGNMDYLNDKKRNLKSH